MLRPIVLVWLAGDFISFFFLRAGVGGRVHSIIYLFCFFFFNRAETIIHNGGSEKVEKGCYEKEMIWEGAGFYIDFSSVFDRFLLRGCAAHVRRQRAD